MNITSSQERFSAPLSGMPAAERTFRKILNQAGIDLNGPQPWDMHVTNPRFFDRALADGTLGIGESYVEGWWECEALDELTAKILRADAIAEFKPTPALIWTLFCSRVVNRQKGRRATTVAKVHYDLGNPLFEAMLGRTMAYSCGYWRTANDLDSAQEAKLDLICRKLDLQPGQRLLDIGCGWGSLARHAATRFGCQVVGITISGPQADYATRWCAGLPVEICLMDYRSEKLAAYGTFDAVACVGMLEHVGEKNLGLLLNTARRTLKDDGLFLIQTIARTVNTTLDLWVDRYIFPNSYLPKAEDIARISHQRFIIEDWHNFGADYDRTLMAWHANFERYAHAARIPATDHFYRMWRYYLLTFAGCFRARSRIQLWQIVFSPRGVAGGYVSRR